MGVLDWLGPLLAPRSPEDAAIARAALSGSGIGGTLVPTSEDYARILAEERAKLLAEQSQSDAALGISGKKPATPPPPPVPPPLPPSAPRPEGATRPTPPSIPTAPGLLGKIEPSFGPAEPPPMPGVSSYGPAATSFEEPPAPIRAEMVNGKLVFTNQALGGTDVGYDAGVDQWQGRALVDQKLLANRQGKAVQRAVGYGPGNESGGGYDGPALRRPEDARFRDFTIQETPDRAPGPVRADQTGFRGSYIPSAPVPDVAGLDQKGFEQQMTEMTKSASPGAQDEFKQRYLEQEGIRQEIARRSVMEGQAAQAQGQGAAGQAAAGFDVARTGIMKDPVADKIKQGLASAEEILAFRERLMKDAEARVQALYGDKLPLTIGYLVEKGLAPTPQKALERLRQTEYDTMLNSSPEIKIALTKATGGLTLGTGPGQ